MDIFIERHITESELHDALMQIMPNTPFLVGTGGPNASHQANVHVTIINGGSLFGEFGVEVGAKLIEQKRFEPWLCGLARALGQNLRTRTVYSGAPKNFDPHNPFYCIVWDGDDAYLGDDSDLDAIDKPVGPVKLLRSLDLSQIEYAERHELPEWVCDRLS